MILSKYSTYFAAALGLAGLLACRPAAVDRELRLAMEDDIITLDPHLHDDSITHSVLFNIYDPLVAFDDQMRIIPALATSWENPDDLTWVFHLRPGVSFHDGQRLTAEDVKFSLDRARKSKVGYYVSTVKAVSVVDSLTVTVATENPSPILLNKLTFVAILPRSSADPAIKPVGTGPYSFVEYRPGDILRLASYAGHWKGKPSIDRAVFRILPDDRERLEALLAGEIALTRDLEMSARGRVEADARLGFISNTSLAVSYLGINFNTKGPLRSRQVRQAIFLALDPDRMVADLQQIGSPSDQMISPYIIGYVPSLNFGRPKLEEARQLLAQAGYPKGFEVTLEMAKSSVPTDGRVVASQLGQVGIRVHVVGLDWPELSDRMDRQQSPFFKLGWSCSSGDASDLFDACLHTKDGTGLGTANMGGYSNRTLDGLIERAGKTMASRERIDLLHQAQRMIMEDLPLIPLYVRNRTFAFDGRLAFRPRQDGRIQLAELAWTK
jgi:peptide/nickel transport system substrate-binding protein